MRFGFGLGGASSLFHIASRRYILFLMYTIPVRDGFNELPFAHTVLDFFNCKMQMKSLDISKGRTYALYTKREPEIPSEVDGVVIGVNRLLRDSLDLALGLTVTPPPLATLRSKN